MKFSKYMDKWLYGKNGYYTNFIEIGKKGDFYTAVSTSMFFGGSIANRFIKSFDEGFLGKKTTILEIGAHQGYLLADIIQFIYTLRPKLLKSLKFAIIEPQKQNQIAQKEYIKKSFGDVIDLIHYNSLEEVKLNSAFIVANELFDSFPCEIIKDDKMLYIKDNIPKFEAQDTLTAKLVKKYSVTKGEISVGFEEYAKLLAKNIKKFEFVTFDYGEKFARGDFSIRVYNKHKVYPFFTLTDFSKEDKSDKELKDMFQNSDITYDVNFAHLIDAFAEVGIKNIDYSTQLVALTNFGITQLLEILKQNVDDNTYLRELNRVKTLLNPIILGEKFKMLRFRK